MKKVTYPEKLLLGRVLFSLQKGLLQLLLKEHVDYREEFLSGKSTLPTYNDKIIYHALGSCMV